LQNVLIILAPTSVPPSGVGTRKINLIYLGGIMAKIQPLGKNVVIQPEKVEEKTESGIILPETAEKEQPQIGKIIALGKDLKNSELKIGDKVLYEKFGMEEIELDNELVLIGLETKIMAKIK